MNFKKILKIMIMGVPMAMTLTTMVLFVIYIVTLNESWGIRLMLAFFATIITWGASIFGWEII